MQDGTRQIHFTEDGGEFNQIGSNLAMICAQIAPRLPSIRSASWANPQQQAELASPAQVVKNAPERV
jgi:hypothetical protein